MPYLTRGILHEDHALKEVFQALAYFAKMYSACMHLVVNILFIAVVTML